MFGRLISIIETLNVLMIGTIGVFADYFLFIYVSGMFFGLLRHVLVSLTFFLGLWRGGSSSGVTIAMRTVTRLAPICSSNSLFFLSNYVRRSCISLNIYERLGCGSISTISSAVCGRLCCDARFARARHSVDYLSLQISMVPTNSTSYLNDESFFLASNY